MFAIEAIDKTPLSLSGSPMIFSPATQQVNFAGLIQSGLNALDKSVAGSEGALKAYALGEPVATHDLMIAMENARHSLQLAVEVRNRLLEAYGELSRMQV